MDAQDSSDPDGRFACDRDGLDNGQCLFEFTGRGSAAAIHRRVAAGHTRQVTLRNTLFGKRAKVRLQCLPVASGSVKTIDCTDGVFAAAGAAVGTTEPVCDFDRACDGTCTFALDCPLCGYDVPACGAPCFACSESVVAAIPVGSSRTVALPRLGEMLLLKCGAPPPGTVCATVTTTTTLIPPDCAADEIACGSPNRVERVSPDDVLRRVHRRYSASRS